MTAIMSFKCEPLLISLSHLVKVTINNKSVEPYDLCDVGISWHIALWYHDFIWFDSTLVISGSGYHYHCFIIILVFAIDSYSDDWLKM